MKHNIFSAAPPNEMRSRTFHLHQDQLSPLKETAKKLGVSQSEIVRRAVSLFMDEYKKRTGAGAS